MFLFCSLLLSFVVIVVVVVVVVVAAFVEVSIQLDESFVPESFAVPQQLWEVIVSTVPRSHGWRLACAYLRSPLIH